MSTVLYCCAKRERERERSNLTNKRDWYLISSCENCSLPFVKYNMNKRYTNYRSTKSSRSLGLTELKFSEHIINNTICCTGRYTSHV